MKDFYKILGVKEDASEEEIRARWVELTKQYHPDRSEESTSDEKIREINEAYQVLKHSSTRVEYDLKKTYGQADRKRTVHFKRWGVTASVLIILIIVGVICIKNFEMNQINQRNQTSQTDQTNQKDQRNQINEINQINQMSQINHTNQIDQADQRNSAVRMDKRSRKPSVTSIPKPIDVKTAQPQVTKTNQINQTDQRNQINTVDVKLELAQFKPPSLLATEDEVTKFLNNYVEHYNRMDTEGFLSLFSSKANQNQKEGLEEIRKIYTDFFNRSQDVRLNTQDMKIEIYQNAVEVKARYEIEQRVVKSGERKIWRGPIRWVLIKEDGTLKILSIDYKHEKIPEGKREESNETS